MKHTPHAVTNEEGSVLLLTLALLVLLTIAGLGILSTTNTDLQITQNNRCFKQNLTRAESAVMEAAQLMAYYESEDSKLKPLNDVWAGDPWLRWINTDSFKPFESSNWDYDSTAQHSEHFTTDTFSGYTAIYEGIATGASLDLSSSSSMRQYQIVGRAEQCNGQLDVIAGYRIRF